MIRRMDATDVEAVVALQQAWALENITHGFAAATHQQVMEAMTPYCLVAEADGKIVGYLMAELHPNHDFCIYPSGASYLEVNDLYVQKGYRSRHIGRQLLACCEELAGKNGVSHFLVSSATKDAEAVRRFYQNQHYAIWTTTFYKKTDAD